MLNGGCVQFDTNFLLKPVTNLEIKSSIFFIGSDKAPEVDGFNSHFFRLTWSIVDSEGCDVVHECFASSGLLKYFKNYVINHYS